MPVAEAAERIIAYAAPARHRADGPGGHGSAEEQALRGAGLVDSLRAHRRAGLPAGRPAGRPPGPADVAVADDLDDALAGGVRPEPTDCRRPGTWCGMILDGHPPRAFAGDARPATGSGRPSAAATSAATGSAWPPSGSTRTTAGGAGRRRSCGAGPLGGPAGLPLRVPAGGRANQAALTAYERLGFARHHHGYRRPGPPAVAVEHRGAPGCRIQDRERTAPEGDDDGSS